MILQDLPNGITAILKTIEQSGYAAYLVGGCVRDRLLGLEPHDWDICTDALPQEILSLFPGSLTYGIKHGTVSVRCMDITAEVTTFRSEGPYTDHRRPDRVTFIRDLRSDLARRDFTVNAMAMDASGNLHDPFSGRKDLQNGVIRAVGDPESRFREDALRMLRAVRFSAQLGFLIESNTRRAIAACAELTETLAAERVCEEIGKTLMTSGPDRVYDMCDSELLKPWGLNRNTVRPLALGGIPMQLTSRWMGFALSLPERFLQTNPLRLPTKTIRVCILCRELNANTPASERDWKRLVSEYGFEDIMRSAQVLSAVQSADLTAPLLMIRQRGDCCTLDELAVDGKAVSALGFRGKQIGIALQTALQYVWDHPENNRPDLLLDMLQKEMNHHE